MDIIESKSYSIIIFVKAPRGLHALMESTLANEQWEYINIPCSLDLVGDSTTTNLFVPTKMCYAS